MIPQDLKRLGAFFGWLLAGGFLILTVWLLGESVATLATETKAATVMLLSLLFVGAAVSIAVLGVRLVAGWRENRVASYLLAPLSLVCFLNIAAPFMVVVVLHLFYAAPR